MECCICQKPSKYKCPECSFRSCSADCVKAHKIVYGCTGIPKPLKFIPLKDFTENKLRKDMNFLMNIIHDSDKSYKMVTKLSRNDSRKRFSYLITECKNKKINLRLMPKAMKRHQQNSSLYDKSEHVIIWHIEWKFGFGSKEIVCETSGNKENVMMKDLVKEALESFRKIPVYVMDYNEVIVDELRVFYLIGKKKVRENVKCLFMEVDKGRCLDGTLPELSDMAEIVEFPTFYLARSEDLAYFLL